MPYINVDEAYILDNTGLQVDQVVDIPYTDAALTETQKEQARKNIAAGGTNPNLLDNPWFTVNQRGVTTLSSAAFPADRWGNGLNTTTSTTSDGVSITNNDSVRRSFNQNFVMPWIVGKTCTASVMLQDGTIYSGTITFPSSGTSDFVSFDGTSIRATYGASYLSVGLMVAAGATVALRAFKLELGSVSTLANDVPPDYGTELEKCKYYFERIKPAQGNYANFGLCYVESATSAIGFVQMHPKRQYDYSITTSGSFRLVGTTTYTISAIAKYSGSVSNNCLALVITSTGMTGGQCLGFTARGDNSCYIDVSSDL